MATARLFNLARMTTATTGTGTVTLGSAVTGFLTFTQAGVTDGATVTYAIKDGNNSEIGRGVYTSSGTTLTRATILNSTNSNNALNLSGSAEVFITPSSEDFLSAVNPQTGTTYTVLATDIGKLVTLSNAASIAVTLPQATGLFGAGWWAYVRTAGAGTATITPTTSTINGAASLVLPSGAGAILFSDGTNWQALQTATSVFSVPVELPDGSASAPSLTNDGDENTGLFFPAADTIAFTMGGTEYVRLNSAGRVDITKAAQQTDLDSENQVAQLINSSTDTSGNLTGVRLRQTNGTNTANGFVGLKSTGSAGTRASLVFAPPNTAGNATERAAIDSSGNLQFNSGYGSVATAYGCRAWVNFNGTGTPAIRASGNVSSITDNGTGDYTVNLTTAMPDTNFAVAVGADYDSQAGTQSFGLRTDTAFTTTSVRLLYQYGGVAADPARACVVIYR